MVEIMHDQAQSCLLEDWRLPPWALKALNYHTLSPIDYSAEETTQKGPQNYLEREGAQWNQAFQPNLDKDPGTRMKPT